MKRYKIVPKEDYGSDFLGRSTMAVYDFKTKSDAEKYILREADVKIVPMTQKEISETNQYKKRRKI